MRFAELPRLFHRLLDPLNRAGPGELAAPDRQSSISGAQVELAHPVLGCIRVAEQLCGQGPRLVDPAQVSQRPRGQAAERLHPFCDPPWL